MHRLPVFGLASLLAIAAAGMPFPGFAAQSGQSGQSSQSPIGRISATEARVSGAVEIDQGEMLLGNGSTVTAEDQAVKIALDRGGQLRLCSTTSLHLSQDKSMDDPKNTALMMALDRGALETNYTVGKYSDVLLTPDLRILISGPGQAELSVRVNAQGDTCVDNHGAAAPYVLVSNQLEGGAYRIMPNQRVVFEHGSLRDVVDREAEPCGCPPAPAISLAEAGLPAKNPAHPGGPSSTAADTAFPIAESEGLAQPPPPTEPAVPAGQTHTEVSVPLTYLGENPGATAGANGNPGSAPPSNPGGAEIATSGSPAPAGATAQPPAPGKNRRDGLFHRIGHFFSRFLR